MRSKTVAREYSLSSIRPLWVSLIESASKDDLLNASRSSMIYFPIVDPQNIMEPQNSLENPKNPDLSSDSLGTPQRGPTSERRCAIALSISLTNASLDRGSFV